MNARGRWTYEVGLHFGARSDVVPSGEALVTCSQPRGMEVRRNILPSTV
jgi:hypothetical protein